MKNILKMSMLVVLLVVTRPVSASPTTPPMRNAAGTEKMDASEVNRLMSRLEEIKAMDTRNMSAPERRALRKEVKAAQRSMQSNGGGLYISVGAAIIIILLLIILL